jgi:DNA adenine methylase
MKLKSPLTGYYGGKSSLLHLLRPLVPWDHFNHYCEPYMGGGALYFELAPLLRQKEIIVSMNDLNPDVANFYQCISGELSESLVSKIKGTLYSEKAFMVARGILLEPWLNGMGDEEKVGRAWALWIGTNMGRWGTWKNGFNFIKSETRGGVGKNAWTFHAKKKYLDLAREILEGTQFFHRDGLALLKLLNDPELFVYLDPPYPGSNQGHYQELQFEDRQFVELMEFLTGDFLGKFLLSNYHFDYLDRFLVHLNSREVPRGRNRSIDCTGNPRVKKKELLIWNYVLKENQRSLFSGENHDL